MDRPFTEKIRRLRPDLWERYVLAVERQRREAVMRREVEQYGRGVRFYEIEEVGELVGRKAA